MPPRSHAFAARPDNVARPRGADLPETPLVPGASPARAALQQAAPLVPDESPARAALQQAAPLTPDEPPALDEAPARDTLQQAAPPAHAESPAHVVPPARDEPPARDTLQQAAPPAHAESPACATLQQAAPSAHGEPPTLDEPSACDALYRAAPPVHDESPVCAAPPARDGAPVCAAPPARDGALAGDERACQREQSQNLERLRCYDPRASSRAVTRTAPTNARTEAPRAARNPLLRDVPARDPVVAAKQREALKHFDPRALPRREPGNSPVSEAEPGPEKCLDTPPPDPPQIAVSREIAGKQCPWCGRWAVKDDACSHVICGVETHLGYVLGHGCGRQYCFGCEQRLCTLAYDPDTGLSTGGRTSHNAACCRAEIGFIESEYCPGGHHSHCPKRW